MEPIELEVRNLMTIIREWEMGSMLVIVVMMVMEVVVVLIIMVNLTLGEISFMPGAVPRPCRTPDIG